MTTGARLTQRGQALDRYAALPVLCLGVLTVATWPVIVAAAGPDLLLPGILAHVSGMLAGYGVLVLLVLMSRWPPLERGVGADVLAR